MHRPLLIRTSEPCGFRVTAGWKRNCCYRRNPNPAPVTVILHSYLTDEPSTTFKGKVVGWSLPYTMHYRRYLYCMRFFFFFCHFFHRIEREGCVLRHVPYLTMYCTGRSVPRDAEDSVCSALPKDMTEQGIYRTVYGLVRGEGGVRFHPWGDNKNSLN